MKTPLLLVTVLSVGASALCGQTEIANSITEFSGIQGQNGWTFGYRNLTADGGARTSYDPDADFIAYAGGDGFGAWDGILQQWTGTQWDLQTSGAPWTYAASEATHPNGTNNSAEHWAIRRWTADELATDQILEVRWAVRKQGAAGTGVTARLHQNGETRATQAIAGTNTAGVTRSTFVVTQVGDRIDLALTPVGPSGDGSDGNDGAFTSMAVFTVVDTDSDNLPDVWEETYFPGDLTQLGAGDKDLDGLFDVDELLAGTNPTVQDTDGDGLLDSEEITSSPLLADTDSDGLTDFQEVNGTPPTNPQLADTDGDTYSDATELFYHSDPTVQSDTPLSLVIANSITQFSGVAGQDGWYWGYRNYTADGGGDNAYDPDTAFIPFPVDGTTTPSAANFWGGANYDWFNGNPPWTFMAAENLHPNSGGAEHWCVRRWEAGGLGSVTPLAIVWHSRKTNTTGDGVTGGVHINGVRQDSRVIAGNNTTGVTRIYYANISDGDRIDQVLTPVGLTTRLDGSDGSASWMRIDERIPAVPVQPDGRYFIPANAVDSDTDGLADFWEEEYFPGDLTQLSGGGDYDLDGATDLQEQTASINPTATDSDGDGRSDGDELNGAPATDPRVRDTDGDGYEDGYEIATGHDPSDPASRPDTTAIAHSVLDYPLSGELQPQGVNGWTYGYYNVTQDGEPSATSQIFNLFPTDGTAVLSATNAWTGTAFDWFNGNPPWTELAQTSGHPNGSNNGDIHWPTRRWEADIPEPAPLALHFHLRKTNTAGGPGTSAVILQNGEQIAKVSVAGTDGVGLRSWRFINAQPEDIIEISLSPEGQGGQLDDGSDGSAFWLIVDPTIPENPKQPDGSPFVIGGGDAGFRIVAVQYDEILGDLTLSWTSSAAKNYRIDESTDLTTWTSVGPASIAGQAGMTEHTLAGVGAPPRYYRVVQLD